MEERGRKGSCLLDTAVETLLLTLCPAPVLSPPASASPPPSSAGSRGRGQAGKCIWFPVGGEGVGGGVSQSPCNVSEGPVSILELTCDTGGPRYPAAA